MKKLSLFRTLVVFLFVTLPIIFYAQNIEAQIDALMSNQYKTNESGATILIAKEGSIVYRKAFGRANLEQNVAMIPENVFEIGSITKQFTAISILMLLEEGKLSLDDEITKYIPDYPTQNTKITIHHLLTHTSGIKSYTSLGSLNEYARKDLSPTELMDLFKNEPMDFTPGEEFRYNNSGYVILGYIIEKITDMPYADFIQKRIFTPLQMNNSYYGSKSKLINNRAMGYQKGNEGYLNANYISMTIPYAAGSLMSTVDDLLKWQRAVQNNDLISKESLQKAFSNYTLNNGNKINYGYGWSHNTIQGIPIIEHGGGIFGYTSQGIYIPSKNTYIIILTNCNCNSPSNIAYKIAAITIGKPYPTIAQAIQLSQPQLDKWVGAYKFEDGVIRVITRKGNQLYSQRTDGNNEFAIFPLSENRFFFEDSFSEFIFTDGTPKSVLFKSNITESKGIATNEKLPEPKREIQLSSEILQKYIGIYELQPNFRIEITVENNQIFAQATNQPKIEIFAETENQFFLKVVPATLTFEIDTQTKKPVRVTLTQNGKKMTGKKVK